MYIKELHSSFECRGIFLVDGAGGPRNRKWLIGVTNLLLNGVNDSTNHQSQNHKRQKPPAAPSRPRFFSHCEKCASMQKTKMHRVRCLDLYQNPNSTQHILIATVTTSYVAGAQCRSSASREKQTQAFHNNERQ